MIKRLVFLSFILATLLMITSPLWADTIWTLDFESTGGYTPSITEFTDSAASTGYDYFCQVDTSNGAFDYNHSSIGSVGSAMSLSNIQGTYFFAGQDLDGEGATLPLNITINDINISGYSDLTFYVYLAEDDESTNQDWDDADYMHIQYRIDDGSWNNLIWVEGAGGLNAEPKIDTNFDGTGDGTAITSTFAQFSNSITGTGSQIDIQVIFNLDSGDEDIAIDNLVITGTAVGQTVTVDSVTDGTNTITSGFTADDHLLDADATVSFTLGQEATDTATIDLWFDVGADPDGAGTGNTDDRKVDSTGSGTSWSAVIPASDSEVVDGALVRFIVEVDGTVYYLTGTTPWKYTVDASAPTVSTYDPADEETGVSTTANLVLTFNENVDAEEGNISLYKTTGDQLIQAFDVTTDISGTGTTTITADPTSNLDSGTDYYVQIAATCFDDAASNSYAGIADKTTWNFTTATLPAVVISEVYYDPTDGTTCQFVELYNPTSSPIDIEGWTISCDQYDDDATLPAGASIPAHSYYLIADTDASANNEWTTKGWPTPDYDDELIAPSTGSDGVKLYNGPIATSNRIDSAGWGTAGDIDADGYETTPFTDVDIGHSIERKPGCPLGNATDAGDNSADFKDQSSPNPQNSISPTVTSVDPSSGSASSTTDITVNGTKFVSLPEVSLWDIATITKVTDCVGEAFVSATQMTATVPSGVALDTYRVVVKNPDKQQNSPLTEFTVNGGDGATKLVFTVAPSSVTAGSETTVFTVQRQAADNSPVTTGTTTVNLSSTSTGAAKEFRATPSGAAVSSVDITEGNSTVDFYYYDTKAGSWTITAAATDLTSAETSLTVNPAATSKFTLSAPSDITAGSEATYTVTRYDQYDNLVTSGARTVDSTGNDEFRATSGGAAVSSVSIADASSAKTFYYYDDKSGTWTITASDATPADGATGIDDATDSLGV